VGWRCRHTISYKAHIKVKQPPGCFTLQKTLDNQQLTVYVKLYSKGIDK
jgi:hypothetical protein